MRCETLTVPETSLFGYAVDLVRWMDEIDKLVLQLAGGKTVLAAHLAAHGASAELDKHGAANRQNHRALSTQLVTHSAHTIDACVFELEPPLIRCLSTAEQLSMLERKLLDLISAEKVAVTRKVLLAPSPGQRPVCLPRAQARLFSPDRQHRNARGAQNADGPGISTHRHVGSSSFIRTGGSPSEEEPTLSPLEEHDLAVLRRVIMQSAQVGCAAVPQPAAVACR